MKTQSKISPRATCKGSALIWVVLCMGVVEGLLAAALTTFLFERKTLLHKQEVLRAEVAVQAAFATAQSLLCKAIAQYPDSVSVWEERLPELTTPGTVLHILQRDDPKQAAHVLTLPLISGIKEPRPAGANFFDTPPELCYFNKFPNWLGDTDSNREELSFSAPWVVLGPEKNDSVLARYAFFVEDESFKLNVQEASLDRAPDVLRTAKDVSIKAILAQLPEVPQEVQEKRARALVALRTQLGGFGDLGQSNLALNLSRQEWNRWKFLCTLYSESLNYTRHGYPRININKLFVSPSSLRERRLQMDDFISAVRRESPHFGQRFYRLKTSDLNRTDAVPQEHAQIYLNKLAAHICDLLTPGPNPTRILYKKDYPLLEPSDTGPIRPAGGFGPNPLVAVGKKRIPYLQEYALVTQLISMEPPKKKATEPFCGAKFEITIDHCLEFWNLSSKPIRVEDLGPRARLVLKNQPPWDLDGGGQTGSGIPSSSDRDVEIPLAHFRSFQNTPLVFRPGEATVLTTLPSLPPKNLFPQGAQFFTPMGFDQAKRRFSGTTYRVKAVEKEKFYEVRTRLRNLGNSDHETEYYLLNDEGWIDGFSYLPVVGSIPMRSDNGQPVGTVFWYVRCSGLQGDEPQSDEIGDPRTLNEQLLLGQANRPAGKSAAMNHSLDLSKNPLPLTRFLRNAGINDFPGGHSSLGMVRGPFLRYKKWPDPVRANEIENSGLAPAVFPEPPLKSIAELGHVFDPARSASLNLGRARGGGRTLRIGQPEFYPSRQQMGIWDRHPLAPAREWTAWRLCDIFSVTGQAVLPGTVNINGLLRQEGAALKALLHDFRWSADGDEELNGSALESEDIQLIIKHFQNRLRRKPPYKTRGGPFFERGEISEIDLFQSRDRFPGAVANASGLGLGGRNDAIREEIVRYLQEMITTRGRVFTVYCVGQAIRRTTPDKAQILATRKEKFIFRLVPLDRDGGRLDQNSLPAENKSLRSIMGYQVELLAREN